MEKINDEVFIQPVVITVKKDKSVKVALDARSLNDAIKEDNSQKPNLDNLMEQVAEITNEENAREVRFTTLGRVYAFGQTNLQVDTADTVIFKLSGKSNGNIRL